jgi:hypothetical protein
MSRSKDDVLRDIRNLLDPSVGAPWVWHETPYSGTHDGNVRAGARLVAEVRREEDGERIVAARALLAECLDLLSKPRLPVIRTCGDCSRYGHAEADETGPCFDERAAMPTPDGLRPPATIGDQPPPEWCPRRDPDGES